MSDRLPVPLNGKILGFALAVLAVAVAVRVAWAVIEPALPTLLALFGFIVVYRVIFGGFKH